jgi:hypothetical protein
LTEFDDFRVFVGYDDYAALVTGLMNAGLTYGTYLNGFGGANVDPNSSDGLSIPRYWFESNSSRRIERNEQTLCRSLV